MGGSKLRDVPENIVMLCRPHHEERTLNKWRDEIRVTVIGRFYIQVFGDGTAKARPLPASSPVAEPSEDDLPRNLAGSATEPGAGAARDDGDMSEAAASGQRTPFTFSPSSSGAGAVISEGEGGGSGSGTHLTSPSETGASVPDSGRKAAPPEDARDASRKIAEAGLKPLTPSAAMTVPSALSDDGRELPTSLSPSSLIFRDNGIEFEPEITFADWREGCERVKSESQGRQWRVGDLVNAGEDRWEEAQQYLDELGYPQETQANYANVARAYLIEDRRPLPFTFHQAVYKLPDRLRWLDRAVVEVWDRETLRVNACGPRAAREKRYTLADIRRRFMEWPGERKYRNNGRQFCEAFFVSLEAKI